MLMLPFLIVVVRVMPSDFESASSEGDRELSDKNGEYQGQRSGIHKPSPTLQTSSTANRVAVTHITDSRGEKRL